MIDRDVALGADPRQQVEAVAVGQADVDDDRGRALATGRAEARRRRSPRERRGCRPGPGPSRRSRGSRARRRRRARTSAWRAGCRHSAAIGCVTAPFHATPSASARRPVPGCTVRPRFSASSQRRDGLRRGTVVATSRRVTGDRPCIADSSSPVSRSSRCWRSSPSRSSPAARASRTRPARRRTRSPTTPITITGTIEVADRRERQGRLHADRRWDHVHAEAGPPWFFGNNHPLEPFVGQSVTVDGEIAEGTTDVDVLASMARRFASRANRRGPVAGRSSASAIPAGRRRRPTGSRRSSATASRRVSARTSRRGRRRGRSRGLTPPTSPPGRSSPRLPSRAVSILVTGRVAEWQTRRP